MVFLSGREVVSDDDRMPCVPWRCAQFGYGRLMPERSLILGEGAGQDKAVRARPEQFGQVEANADLPTSIEAPRLLRGGLQQTLWPENCCSPGLQTRGFSSCANLADAKEADLLPVAGARRAA